MINNSFTYSYETNLLCKVDAKLLERGARHKKCGKLFTGAVGSCNEVLGPKTDSQTALEHVYAGARVMKKTIGCCDVCAQIIWEIWVTPKPPVVHWGFPPP